MGGQKLASFFMAVKKTATPAAKKVANKTTSGTSAQPYVSIGERLGEIPVHISYRIIELFSAGLYRSANKAIEELVANSWDAVAHRVWLCMPNSLKGPNPSVWVVDDGAGMDEEELAELWWIARSPKEGVRDDPGNERPPIGKFGIGKLATYLLANRLTYISRKNGRVLAVTMDYTAIDRESSGEETVNLDLRELRDAAEVAAALAPLRALPGGNDVADELLGNLSKGNATWTVAAMSNLKPLASTVSNGRLRWLLSTALPFNPKFAVTLNGTPIKSVVEDTALLKEWEIGGEDDLPTGFERGADDGGSFVDVEGGPGPIRGRVQVFQDQLTKNKAGLIGNSNGFFVKVRDRLINVDDPLFGLEPLSHSTFSRFRMEVRCDGLDELLASTREAVQDDAVVTRFRAFLRWEFNRARGIYDDWIRKNEDEATAAGRVDKIPPSLSRRPLVSAVKALLEGGASQLSLINATVDTNDVAGFIRELEETLEPDGDGPIRDVVEAALGPDQFLASYDATSRVVTVNVLHPFYANFIESVGRTLPFSLLAVVEVLTEAFVFEAAGEQVARDVVGRRDAVLRELVDQNREGPAVIAQNLREQADDEDGLEVAVTEAMRSLGYAVTRIGGKKNPDGVAVAELGVRAAGEGVRGDYSITYDAKSTGKRAVAAKTVGISTLVRHRESKNADYRTFWALKPRPPNRPNTDMAEQTRPRSNPAPENPCSNR